MDIKEAKKILTNMLGCGWIEEKEGEAIVTVLNELDNSIPKSKIIGNINEIKLEDLEDELKSYYIPKSKIEAKIKELKERCKKEYDTGCTYCGNYCRYYSRCELCKELLRGEE